MFNLLYYVNYFSSAGHTSKKSEIWIGQENYNRCISTENYSATVINVFYCGIHDEYVMEQTLYSSQSWIGPPVAPIKAQRMYYAYLH